jgi:hypothetical protein
MPVCAAPAPRQGVRPVHPVTSHPSSKKHLDQMRHLLRAREYSIRTESAYVEWVQRFIRFRQLGQPASMGKPETEPFLSRLVVQSEVASSTHTVPPHASGVHATSSRCASRGERGLGGELHHHRAKRGLPEESILECQEVGDPRLGVGFPDLTVDRDEEQGDL